MQLLLMRLGLRHLRGRFAECDALGDVAVPRPLHEHRLSQARLLKLPTPLYHSHENLSMATIV